MNDTYLFMLISIELAIIISLIIKYEDRRERRYQYNDTEREMREKIVRLYKDEELILEKYTNQEIKDIIDEIDKEGYEYDKIRITFNKREK